MYDPIIFENLKIGFENQLYDLELIEQEIHIIDRKDLLDMAIMSREWSLSFTLADKDADLGIPITPEPVHAEIVLRSHIKDISDEILERIGEGHPACQLLLRFHCVVTNPALRCLAIEQALAHIWERDMHPIQSLTYVYGQSNYEIEGSELVLPKRFQNVIELPFNRMIGEEQMEDIEELIRCTINALHAIMKIVQ